MMLRAPAESKSDIPETPPRPARIYRKPASAEVLDAMDWDVAEKEFKLLSKWFIATLGKGLAEHFPTEVDRFARQVCWRDGWSLNVATVTAYTRPGKHHKLRRWIARVSVNIFNIAHGGLGAVARRLEARRYGGWRLELSCLPTELDAFAIWLPELAHGINNTSVQISPPPHLTDFKTWRSSYVWTRAAADVTDAFFRRENAAIAEEQARRNGGRP